MTNTRGVNTWKLGPSQNQKTNDVFPDKLIETNLTVSHVHASAKETIGSANSAAHPVHRSIMSYLDHKVGGVYTRTECLSAIFAMTEYTETGSWLSIGRKYSVSDMGKITGEMSGMKNGRSFEKFILRD